MQRCALSHWGERSSEVTLDLRKRKFIFIENDANHPSVWRKQRCTFVQITLGRHLNWEEKKRLRLIFAHWSKKASENKI